MDTPPNYEGYIENFYNLVNSNSNSNFAADAWSDLICKCKRLFCQS
jgi:hypothetical protein